MGDLIKLMDELLKDLPEVNQMIEEDNKWIDERKNLYLKKGLNEKDANLESWNDYWKMAHERDGVEFSIHKIK